MAFIKVSGWFRVLNVLTHQSLLAGVAIESRDLKPSFSRSSLAAETFKKIFIVPQNCPVSNVSFQSEQGF